MATFSSSDTVTKALRLFTILHLVASRRQGRRIGRRELARACECCEKTIHRDIRDLQSAHIPIEYDPSERTYCLPEKDWTLPALTLNLTDALALALARGLMTASATGFPLAAEVEVALDKVTAGLPPALRAQMEAASIALHDLSGMARDYSQAPLRLLLLAIARRETIEMLYESRSSGTCERRRVDPYRIDRREGRYLELQAWCPRHQQVRTFALDRIMEARLTGETFVARPWNESDEGVIGGLRGGQPIEVVVRFDGVVAPFARERRWPFKATFEPTPEGGVILHGVVQGVEGIARELLSWRRHAVVLGGAELRSRMSEEIQAMARLYTEERHE